ncbi:hypothetical protein PENANT_c001G02652 [Penicillium antarcticum]|uniref:Uncharacterized protein n=1 Tax=Penicillium antarcticum TaxID=416450 RepID=A0A1V6QNA3_9EURO|nr:hypothetical protein PENANT_c001G02652 [Penicillium antarcticum]
MKPNAREYSERFNSTSTQSIVSNDQTDECGLGSSAAAAYKYSQQARFYNKTLHLVSAAQCVRAAMGDGSNTVLMSLRQECKVTRAKMAEVAEMFKADRENQDVDDGNS